jgi:hypothetical protein
LPTEQLSRFAALLCALLISACSNNPYPAAFRDTRDDGSPWQVRYMAMPEDPRSLDPQVSYDNVSRRVLEPLQECLLEYHPFKTDPYQLSPCLLKSMPERLEREGGGVTEDVNDGARSGIRAALAMQLALAADLGLPLFLHLREADEPAADGGAPALDALCAALASAPPLPRGGVVHSFDGSAASLARVLALPQRLDVGVNGCSLRTATNLSVAATIPLDRLLLESDAPWCGLRPAHASAAHAPAQAKAVDAKKWAPGARVKGRNEPAAVAAASTSTAPSASSSTSPPKARDAPSTPSTSPRDTTP